MLVEAFFWHATFLKQFFAITWKNRIQSNLILYLSSLSYSHPENTATSSLKLRFWRTKKIYRVRGGGGYYARFFKLSPASAFSPMSDHDKSFTEYPTLHLLLSTGVHLSARLKGPQQESQRGVIVKIIRAVWGKIENKKFKKHRIWELQYKAKAYINLFYWKY